MLRKIIRHPIRAMASFLAVATLLTTLACDPKWAVAIQLGLAGGPAVFDVLVQAGAINDSTRTELVRDFTEGSGYASTLQTDLTACAKDKVCKLKAVEKFSDQIISVFARGRTNDPRIQRIFAIVRDIVTAAAIFYGGKAAPTSASVRAARAAGGYVPTTRAAAKRVMELKIKELKIALQP